MGRISRAILPEDGIHGYPGWYYADELCARCQFVRLRRSHHDRWPRGTRKQRVEDRRSAFCRGRGKCAPIGIQRAKPDHPPGGHHTPDRAFAQAVREILYWESEIDRVPPVLTRIRKATDIAAAKQTQRTGLIYGFQDGVALKPISRA